MKINISNISQLGVSHELFEVMASKPYSSIDKIKLNRKKIRREIKKRKRAKVKGLRA